MKSFLWIFLFVATAHSSAFDVSLNSENERLLIARLNTGAVLSDVYIAYDLDRNWYLPLEATAALLGFDITVFTKEKIAKGSRLNKRLFLELESCSVSVDEEKGPYPCHMAKLYEDDIYVESSYLQMWLGVDIKIYPYKSIIEFVAKKGIPIYDRMLRDKDYKFKKSSRKKFDTGFKLYQQKPKNFGGFVVDQNLSIQGTKSNGSNPDVLLSHQTQVDAQLLKGQLHINTVGEDKFFDQSNIRLSWKSVNDKEEYSHTQLGDIYTQPLNLIGGGGRGQGLSYSSYPFYSTYEYTTQNFEGTLPPNWEVELYMNETLIQRTVVGPSGRYLFEEVPIFYGNNRVKFVYYGPQGQKQVEFRSINVGQNLIKKGKSQSVVSVIKSDATDEQNLILQSEYGLWNNLTLRGAYSNYYLHEKDQSYALVGGSGYLGPLLMNYNFAQNTSNQGTAHQLATSFNFWETYWNISAAQLDNYSSSNLNPNFTDQKAEYKANLSFNIFSGINLISTYEKKEYEKSLSTDNLSQRLSFRLGRVYFSFLKNFLNSEKQDTYIVEYQQGSQRLTSEYTEQSGQSSTLSLRYQKRLGYRSLFDLSDTYSYFKDSHTYSFGLQKLFKKINLGLSYIYDELYKEHRVSLNLFYGLGYSPKTSALFVTGENQTNRGNASFFVYHDKNANNKFDKKDEAIKDAEINWIQMNQSSKTNKDGLVYFSNLPTFQDVDFSFKQASLKSLDQFPVEEGVKFKLISGEPYHYDFIVQDLYEIEALVVESENGKSAVPIIVEDSEGNKVKSVRTDSEGYVLFQRLKKQDYKFYIDPDYLTSKSYISEPEFISASFKNTDDLFDQLIFRLKPR